MMLCIGILMLHLAKVSDACAELASILDWGYESYDRKNFYK